MPCRPVRAGKNFAASCPCFFYEKLPPRFSNRILSEASENHKMDIRVKKENSSSPQIVGGGVGFEFLSCFCAGFVCLLSEEAPENGAKFGAKSLDEQNWERSLWNLTPLWRRKPQLGSFPTPTPAVL